LPGGFFFVNKGLILAADNEAELAGVMAHEIAHVAARHAMENQGKMQAIQYGLLGTILFGGGIAGAIAQNAGGFAQLLSFMQFSRGAETEADTLGVQYLYASGYDPTAMAAMFEKLSAQNKKKPGTLSKIFASHPQSIDRRDASLALVARFPEKEEYIISTSEFQRVKAHLLKITNARAGCFRGYRRGRNSEADPETTSARIDRSGRCRQGNVELRRLRPSSRSVVKIRFRRRLQSPTKPIRRNKKGGFERRTAFFNARFRRLTSQSPISALRERHP
jgi:predicted Zn-dependent protease